MMNATNPIDHQQMQRIKWLTYMMFMMFAMTTDAVGVIIPEIITAYDLSLTAASAFHYVPMIAIALSGLLLGFLADKLGRKTTIILGLIIFSVTSFLFAVGDSFWFFLTLMVCSGCAIGFFKTGALALIGDISASGKEHTTTMNTVEGFFGVGAIIGPAIVSYLLVSGFAWKYLYVIAGILCAALCLLAWKTNYPAMKKDHSEEITLKRTLHMMKNPYALGFSSAIALYVITEVAIYVWMPTLLRDYQGDMVWLATYALTIFFVFRAFGRFLGAWVLSKFNWMQVMFVTSLAIFCCYFFSMIYGIQVAVFLLPLSGLFMSMIYPTLNSKGISCFKKSEHGAVAGVILFFTAVAAALGPLAMGAVSDLFGDVKYGFYLATGFAGMLFLMMAFNLLKKPTQEVLLEAEHG
ncbi:MFS transporter [Thalassomonas sp. RHCl1]|uniref:MFS transporter n=1 Tax=Thalassomonas sp. RHCl1 TaxID=2995320 RepID=UPI00248BFA72|nr:MFS transporter [Thalassomonas sp. RHCl1]